MAETARRAFVFTAVAVAVVAGALALWKLRLLIALLFLAFIVAAAMRPGVERMRRRHIPRPLGVAVQYAALFAVIGLLLWAVVPRATEQVEEAVAGLPGSSSEIRQKAEESSGLERELLVGLQRWLEDLPSGRELVDPALEAGILGFEILIGIFFVLATAAYWIFERDHAVRLFTSLLPPAQREVARDTWDLIDLKLGAYVRGQALLILLVGTVLSLLFWGIGLPYWLLIGAFAGVVEIVPVIGPLAAGAVAVGVGLTDSWQVALAAGLAVLVVRLAEDYLVIPRVLGGAVGMSPLIVLVAITGTAILFGEFAVLLAVPIAAVAATLLDVMLLEKNPAEEDVPAVLFPAKEAEPAGRR